ncbi:GNAT family N-acetyltransferase [Paenibacillus sp. CMAA1364]
MELRLIRENELKEAVLLADRIFCAEGEHNMGISFPTLFQPGISHSYAAFNDEGKLIAFIGMVPLLIQSAKARLQAYSIGAVCTDPAYQGQRIAGQLLTLCQQHAKDAGASLLFISGDRSLYTRAGSVSFGRSIHYVIDDNTMLTSDVQSCQLTVSDMKPQDMFYIHDLMMQKSAAIQWSMAELAQFIGASPMASIHHMNQHVRIARTADQRIVAVAIFAIPKADSIDNAGTLVEYAGEPTAVAAMISDAMTHYSLHSLSVTLPWQDVELANQLQGSDATMERQENAGLVLVVDAESLINQAGYGEGTHDSTTITTSPDGTYQLNTPDGSSNIGGNRELCSLLFDPDSTVEQHSDHRLDTIALPYMYGLYFI